MSSHVLGRFKPYSDPAMQRLSTRCCFLLVTVSSVLLRSQTLLSSARAINFAPTEPDEAAAAMPLDVQVSVFIILSSLVLPFVWLVKPLNWLPACISLIKRRCGKQPCETTTRPCLDPAGGRTQKHAQEGFEMAGLTCRDESAARGCATSSATLDEEIDLVLDLFSGSSDAKFSGACAVREAACVRAPVVKMAAAADCRSRISHALPRDAALLGDHEVAPARSGECGRESIDMKAALVWQDALRDFGTRAPLGGLHDAAGWETPGRGAGSQAIPSVCLLSGMQPQAAAQQRRLDGASLEQC